MSANIITGNRTKLDRKGMAEFNRLTLVSVVVSHDGNYEVREDDSLAEFHASLYFLPFKDKKAVYSVEVNREDGKVFWLELSRHLLKFVNAELNPLVRALDSRSEAEKTAADLLANAKSKPAKIKAKAKATKIRETAAEKVDEARTEVAGLIKGFKAEIKANREAAGLAV